MPSSYVLVIAEKPRAAAKIAEALGAKTKLMIDGVRVWVGEFLGKAVVITSTAGHLYTLYTNERGFPVFKCDWGPRWLYEPKSGHLRKYYNVLKRLSTRAEAYVNACDFDIEGSVIGFNIINFLGDIKRASRAKFSALTKEDIIRAFKNLQPLDWNYIESGLARHILDWVWGINVSRALMEIYSKVYKNKTVLSAGRVQSPTLLELVKRHIERETFVPVPMFTVTVKISHEGREYTLSRNFEPFRSLDEAKKVVEALKASGKLIVTQAERRIIHLDPPPPFNLTELQVEAAKVFGYSPARTLKIAEDLYLESLISYPRTNSEKIPPTIDNTQILRKLTYLPDLGNYALELLRRNLTKPREGLGEDPAHPAIHPTGYLPSRNLNREQRNLYDMIVRRYLASFYPSSKIEDVVYVIKEPSTGLSFTLTGRRIVSYEWLRVYRFRKVSNVEAPSLRVGEEVKILSVKLVKIYTQRPPPYTKASILKWMESVGIGTEATRAEIIETLVRRGYVRGKNMEVTELGLRVAWILETLFKEITEVELTREFERKLQAILQGKLSKEEVVSEAISRLNSKLSEIKKAIVEYEDRILKEKLRLAGNVGRCVVCGEDSIDILEGMSLCPIHLRAYENLIKNYSAWKENLNMNFEEYIDAVHKLRSTGRYVKELIKYLNRRVK